MSAQTGSDPAIDSATSKLKRTQLCLPYENEGLFDLNTYPRTRSRPRRDKFFGYNVSPESLVEFLKKCGVETPAEWTPSWFMMNAPRELKKIFGTLLELHTVHDDGTFPPHIHRLEDTPKSPAMVLVVCDCDQWFNGWRPKKVTLDRMTAELGSKPRWWSLSHGTLAVSSTISFKPA